MAAPALTERSPMAKAGPRKNIAAQIKLQCPAGQATPAPPIGPALGQHGVQIMDFCKPKKIRVFEVLEIQYS